MMKMDFRNCLAAVAVLPLLLSGCVDDTYDLGRYDGSQENIVVGDVIETPPVSARLTFEGLLGGMDEIEKILMRMLSEEGGRLVIKRNEFADKVGCVPSQINYVITSRFTPEKGYVIESRRGGGGYIMIAATDDYVEMYFGVNGKCVLQE